MSTSLKLATLWIWMSWGDLWRLGKVSTGQFMMSVLRALRRLLEICACLLLAWRQHAIGTLIVQWWFHLTKAWTRSLLPCTSTETAILKSSTPVKVHVTACAAAYDAAYPSDSFFFNWDIHTVLSHTHINDIMWHVMWQIKIIKFKYLFWIVHKLSVIIQTQRKTNELRAQRVRRPTSPAQKIAQFCKVLHLTRGRNRQLQLEP